MNFGKLLMKIIKLVFWVGIPVMDGAKQLVDAVKKI